MGPPTMRTRAFIGLVILAIILMIVSTPALLTPTAREIQKGAVMAKVPGVPDPDATTPTPSRKPAATAIAANKKLRQLALKGYVASGTDMRDLLPVGARHDTRSGRLAAGSSRTGLPGATQGSDPAFGSPATSQDGLLLDAELCPVFPVGADVAELLADATTKQRYEDGVASSTDPATCRTRYQATVDAATGASGPDLTIPAAVRRQQGAATGQRQSLIGLAVSLREISLLEDMLGDGGVDQLMQDALTDVGTSSTSSSASSTATTGSGSTTATGSGT